LKRHIRYAMVTGSHIGSRHRLAGASLAATVIVNSFVVGLIFAVSDRLNTHDRLAGPVEVALLALLYSCLGVVYFGWIALLPASISASVWTYLVRRYVRNPLGSGGNSA
jgi:hypothetical protein